MDIPPNRVPVGRDTNTPNNSPRQMEHGELAGRAVQTNTPNGSTQDLSGRVAVLPLLLVLTSGKLAAPTKRSRVGREFSQPTPPPPGTRFPPWEKGR